MLRFLVYKTSITAVVIGFQLNFFLKSAFSLGQLSDPSFVWKKMAFSKLMVVMMMKFSSKLVSVRFYADFP